MKKVDRQKLIVELVKEYPIGTQEDLIQVLNEQGVYATQATISRDIRELGIVKQAGEDGKVRFVHIPPKKNSDILLEEVLADMVTHVVQVQFMLILHTQLGTADMVAALIDESDFEEIAGTIAGTDTVIVIAKTEELASSFKKHLEDNIEKGA